MKQQKSYRCENTITYIGHSTILINLNNINIITDPVYNKKISYIFKRYIEPVPAFEDLPEIDLIVISHEHYDHLDKATLKKI